MNFIEASTVGYVNENEETRKYKVRVKEKEEKEYLINLKRKEIEGGMLLLQFRSIENEKHKEEASIEPSGILMIPKQDVTIVIHVFQIKLVDVFKEMNGFVLASIIDHCSSFCDTNLQTTFRSFIVPAKEIIQSELKKDSIERIRSSNDDSSSKGSSDNGTKEDNNGSRELFGSFSNFDERFHSFDFQDGSRFSDSSLLPLETPKIKTEDPIQPIPSKIDQIYFQNISENPANVNLVEGMRSTLFSDPNINPTRHNPINEESYLKKQVGDILNENNNKINNNNIVLNNDVIVNHNNNNIQPLRSVNNFDPLSVNNNQKPNPNNFGLNNIINLNTNQQKLIPMKNEIPREPIYLNSSRIVMPDSKGRSTPGNIQPKNEDHPNFQYLGFENQALINKFIELFQIDPFPCFLTNNQMLLRICNNSFLSTFGEKLDSIINTNVITKYEAQNNKIDDVLWKSFPSFLDNCSSPPFKVTKLFCTHKSNQLSFFHVLISVFGNCQTDPLYLFELRPLFIKISDNLSFLGSSSHNIWFNQIFAYCPIETLILSPDGFFFLINLI